MANDRVQAKIDITKGKDETGEVKNSLGSFQNKINDARDELVRLGGSTTDASAKLAVAKQRLEEAASSANIKKSALMGLVSEVDKYGGQLKNTSDAEEEAKNKGNGFADSLNRIKDIALGVGLERLAEKFVSFSRNALTFATNYASNMEQSRIAFDAFTGSVALGGKALADVAEFARTTPFELPEIIDAGQQLLGFGFKTDELKDKLREAGSLAAATHKPMSVAIDLFARAREGMFNLREFGQFGISREALASFGIQFTNAGEAINKADLLPSLEKLINSRFGDMLAKESKTLSGTVNNIKDDFGRLAGAFMGVETSGSNIGQAKRGSLFELLQKEANNFYNWIESHQQQISEFGSRIAEAIRVGAEGLINWIVAHKGEILSFGKAVLDTFGKVADWILHSFVPALVNLYHWVDQNRWILAVVAGVLGGVVVVAIVGVITAIGGFIASIVAVIGSIAAFVTSALGIASIIGGVVVGAVALAILYWNQLKDTVFNVGIAIKGFAIDIANSVIDMINGMIGALESLINGAAKLASKIPGVKFDVVQLGKFDRLTGGNGMKFDVGSALVGSALGGPAGLAGAAASYMTGSNNKSVNITNNNNFSSASDPQAFAQYQAWQINGR